MTPHIHAPDVPVEEKRRDSPNARLTKSDMLSEFTLWGVVAAVHMASSNLAPIKAASGIVKKDSFQNFSLMFNESSLTNSFKEICARIVLEDVGDPYEFVAAQLLEHNEYVVTKRCRHCCCYH